MFKHKTMEKIVKKNFVEKKEFQVISPPHLDSQKNSCNEKRKGAILWDQESSAQKIEKFIGASFFLWNKLISSISRMPIV